MIGKFWSTGITLKWNGHDKWWARAKWHDDGHATPGSAWLKMGTSYALPIEQAIDTLMQDAAKFDLPFVASISMFPRIYIENEDDPCAPNN